MLYTLNVKPFSFSLTEPLVTSKRTLQQKHGWLIRLESQTGQLGWGEVSPLNLSELKICESLLDGFNDTQSRQELEDGTRTWPGPLAFGLGAALAEIDGLVGSNNKTGWLKSPPSAILLPNNKLILSKINFLVKDPQTKSQPLTLKWKVAVETQAKEKELLHRILELLPSETRLRIDANASWSLEEAKHWANQLVNEPRLEWLEQPLAAHDFEGLRELSEQVPIALDESLVANPSLRKEWQSWQIRRPLLDGDPRLLLQELNQGLGYRVLSTAFETGIGLRWLHHLAALQQKGPTPTAPGLAPGWCPNNRLLFCNDPHKVWEAACKS